MGLFGRYTEKDFKARTDEFVIRIQNLHLALERQMGVGRRLMKLVAMLRKDSYPKRAKNKDIRAIDERIAKLIDSMERDAQQQNIPKLSAHADMLFEAVTFSRKYGKERYPQRYLDIQEKKILVEEEIFKVTEKQQEIEQKKEEIYEKAKISEPGEAFAVLERQYEALRNEEKALKERLDALYDESRACTKIMQEYDYQRPGPIALTPDDLSAPPTFTDHILEEEFFGQKNPKETEGPKESMTLAERLGRL